MTLRTAQIGKAGEIYLQYRLLLLGIESSPMTTDTGIDLVVYSASASRPFTVQVKTNAKAKPGGGKGRLALDWWVPVNCPADFIALVDLGTERVWVMKPSELEEHAQQQSNGRLHIYMYQEVGKRPSRTLKPSLGIDFEGFLLDNRIHELFDV